MFLAALLKTSATINTNPVPRRPRTRRNSEQLSAVTDLAQRFANVEGIPISFAVKLPAQLSREAADRMEGFEFALATELQARGECGFTGHHDRRGWLGHHVHGLAVVRDSNAFSGLLRRLVVRHFGDLLPRARKHTFTLEEHDDPTAPHTVLHWQLTLADEPVRQCAWALDYAAGHFGQGGCLMNPRMLGYSGDASLLQVGPDQPPRDKP